jgi:hypothetical protein
VRWPLAWPGPASARSSTPHRSSKTARGRYHSPDQIACSTLVFDWKLVLISRKRKMLLIDWLLILKLLLTHGQQIRQTKRSLLQKAKAQQTFFLFVRKKG